jgi:hypothetical protein
VKVWRGIKPAAETPGTGRSRFHCQIMKSCQVW